MKAIVNRALHPAVAEALGAKVWELFGPGRERVRHPAKVVTQGSSAVKIFGCGGRGPFTVAWREFANGPRLRKVRSTAEDAKALATSVATALANGQAAMTRFTEEDRAGWRASVRTAAQIGLRPEVAVSHWVDFKRSLPAGVSELDLVNCWHRHHPAAGVPERVTETAAQLMALKSKDGRSKRWLRTLKQQVKVFATRFDCLWSEVTAREVALWLESLPGGMRTRKNYFGAARELARFAKARGQLTFDLFSDVDKPEPPAVDVQLYTPDELVGLLATAESRPAGRKMLPFLCVTAFAGIRHSEAAQLDWRDVDLQSRTIFIRAAVAKTRVRRSVDMPDNLVAWLTPHARTSGRLCTVANTSNALHRILRRAGIKSKRNSLRKSCISYQAALTRNLEAIADQCGNSPGMIRRNYRRVDSRTKADAERWFGILPQHADVLPLFAWAKESL